MTPASTCANHEYFKFTTTSLKSGYAATQRPGSRTRCRVSRKPRLLEPDGKSDVTKKALITGVTGQDGSYLAELLLNKGYEVHGLIRRASTFNTVRLEHLYRDPHDPEARLFLHYGDLTEGSRLATLLQDIRPDEVYNLGAQSHVRVSFDDPEYTGNTTGLGSMRLLEAVRKGAMIRTCG